MLENAVEGAKPNENSEERDYIAEFNNLPGLSHGSPRTQEGAKIMLDALYESLARIDAELEPLRRRMSHPRYE
jgi:hypothetical protein